VALERRLSRALVLLELSMLRRRDHLDGPGCILRSHQDKDPAERSGGQRIHLADRSAVPCEEALDPTSLENAPDHLRLHITVSLEHLDELRPDPRFGRLRRKLLDELCPTFGAVSEPFSIFVPTARTEHVSGGETRAPATAAASRDPRVRSSRPARRPRRASSGSQAASCRTGRLRVSRPTAWPIARPSTPPARLDRGGTSRSATH